MTNIHEKHGAPGHERAPLGLVWIRSGAQLAALGLEKELSAVARVYSGQAAPSGEAPSAVILCPDRENDVTSEVGMVRSAAPDAAVLVFATSVDLALARGPMDGGQWAVVSRDVPGADPSCRLRVAQRRDGAAPQTASYVAR